MAETNVNTPNGPVTVIHPEGASESDILEFAQQQFLAQQQAQTPLSADVREPLFPADTIPGTDIQPGLASRGLVGGLEAAAGLTSGAGAVPGGGLVGLGAAAAGEDLGSTVDFIESGTDFFTFKPRTALGRKLLGDLQEPLESAFEAVQDVSRQAADPFGVGLEVPGIAPAVETILGSAPALLGGSFRSANPVLSKAGRAGGKVPRLTPRQELARQGNNQGFVFNPKDIKAGPGGSVEGVAGAPKLNASLSNKNMSPTTQLINEDLGIKSNPRAPTPLEHGSLELHAKAQGGAYQALNDIPRVFTDGQYLKQFDSAVKALRDLVKENPEFAASTKVNKLLDGVDPRKGHFSFSGSNANTVIKRLREEAGKRYKKGNSLEGRALSDTANALSKAIERDLNRRGNFRVVEDIQEARRIIAKTHSVMDALGDRGGIVPSRLVAQRKAGRPLDGNLATIADYAQAFPEQMKNVSAPTIFSEFEGLAAVTGATAGFGAIPAFIASKPGFRGAVGTQFGQRLNFPGPGHPGFLPGLITSGALAQQGLLEPPSVFNQ
jgi:hypothetical protein